MVMVETVEQERKRLYDALERWHERLADAIERNDTRQMSECHEMIRALKEALQELLDVERMLTERKG